jgi:hypothetical protein
MHMYMQMPMPRPMPMPMTMPMHMSMHKPLHMFMPMHMYQSQSCNAIHINSQDFGSDHEEAESQPPKQQKSTAVAASSP